MVVMVTTHLGCHEPRTAAPVIERVSPVDASRKTLAATDDRFLELADVTIRYRELGSGPPVLLLHGYAQRLEMWQGTADSLARTFRVIVPDLRGFGKSTMREPRPGDMLAVASDVHRLCDALTSEPLQVVGHSLGAVVATRLVLDDPGRFTAMTVVSGIFWDDSASAHRWLSPHLTALRGDSGLASFTDALVPGRTDSVRRTIARHLVADTDRRVLQHALAALPGLMPRWDRVRHAAGGVTVIVGTSDPFWTANQRLASQWPGATFVPVPGGDHFSAVDASAIAAAVRRMAHRGR